jgi:uncharacterized membrane-anchored protein YjiN (DUF445 family)
MKYARLEEPELEKQELKKPGLNRRVASLLLLVSAIGSFILYPFHTTLIGGLFSSGFIASLVGGCADWFAVNALFRKPLGVPFKTEILIKNRDKLFSALTDMVENELLTKDNILQKVLKLDFSAMLLDSFADEQSRASVRTLIERFVADILSSLNAKKTGGRLYRLLQDNFSDLRLSPLLAKGIALSVKNGYDTNLLELLLRIAKKAAENSQFDDLVIQIVHETRRRYEGNKLRRKITNQLLLSDLTDEKILQYLKDWLNGFIAECRDPSSPARQRTRAFLLRKAGELENGGDAAKAVEEAKSRWLHSNPAVKTFCESIAERLTAVGSNLAPNSLGGRLADSVMDFAAQRLVAFRASKELQDRFNVFIRQKIAVLIDENHARVGKIVQDNLSRYSGAELAAMIEDKAGDDLQMIRINGTIVGGLSGMLLYLLTIWIQ